MAFNDFLSWRCFFHSIFLLVSSLLFLFFFSFCSCDVYSSLSLDSAKLHTLYNFLWLIPIVINIRVEKTRDKRRESKRGKDSERRRNDRGKVVKWETSTWFPFCRSNKQTSTSSYGRNEGWLSNQRLLSKVMDLSLSRGHLKSEAATAVKANTGLGFFYSKTSIPASKSIRVRGFKTTT